MSDPRRGEIWLVDLGEPMGHESGFRRPAVIVSDDPFHQHGLAVLCPITSTRRGYPTRVELDSADTGLDQTSYVQVEQVRTISAARLVRRLGRVGPVEMAQLDRVLRLLLRL